MKSYREDYPQRAPVEAEELVVLVGEDYAVWELYYLASASKCSNGTLDKSVDVETKNVDKQYGRCDCMAIFYWLLPSPPCIAVSF